MTISRRTSVITVSLGLVLWGGSLINRPAAAQEASSQPKTEKATPRDEYQRSLKIYEFTKAAKSGPARGEELYYYK